ncbi:Bug family tripartite tricarboxylate transporter substrate binding protein [Variovorax sp. GB1P17]|uniref:Bug family tripartite tricarboxylate transporter substrate binding protein n=1 Tax=Variovorax sp. GB1P17 TaxID=3443740 RepID=UPI003F4530F1
MDLTLFKLARRALALSLLAAAASLPAVAQSDRTTIVVPYPPGSAPDVLARIVAQKVGQKLGRSVIVDNRPGANAIIGTEYVAKSKNDGSVLLLVDRMTIVTNPLLYTKLPYDPAGLKGVSDVGSVDLLLSVKGDAPVTDWKSFVAYAKAHPGEVTMGSGGAGSVHHLSQQLLAKSLGASFTHVPYKGIAPAVQDVLSSQLFAVISGPEVIQPHMAGGRLRVLATGARQRLPLLPQVPTLEELGVTSIVLLPTTFTLFAPPNTPEAATAAFGKAVREVAADPDTSARLAPTGLVPKGSTPPEISAALGELRPKLRATIRENNIHLD